MRSTSVLLALLVACGCIGCGTTASSDGTGTTDDTVTDDTALADDAAAGSDASLDASSTGDTTTATDTKSNKDTTLGADVADTKSGGADDVAIADTWGVDGVSTPDVAKDSGPAPDVDTSVCAAACNNMAKAKCPQDDPVDVCIAGCVSFETQYGAVCQTQITDFMKCVTNAQIQCVNGTSDESVCQKEQDAMTFCIGNSTGPTGCGTASCYGGAGSGGAMTCGCVVTCNQKEYKLDCDGKQCTCQETGTPGAIIPQADICTTDVQAALKANCVPKP